MVAASLPRYLRDRSPPAALVVALATLLVGLGLLAYAVFLAGQTSDPTLDVRLLAPFRWSAASPMA